MYRILCIQVNCTQCSYTPQVSYDGKVWLELSMIKDNDIVCANFSSYVKALEFCNENISDRINTSIKLYEYSEKI